MANSSFSITIPELFPESTFTPPKPEQPKPSLWTSVDNWGVEIEVGEFLYGLVRLLKPTLVVETGSYPGVSTRYLIEAIEANGAGELQSYEYSDEWRDLMKTRFGDRVEFPPPKQAGVIFHKAEVTFLDSAYEQRQRELKQWLNVSHTGTVCVLHDTAGEWNPHIPPAVVQRFYFATPRGLTILQKQEMPT